MKQPKNLKEYIENLGKENPEFLEREKFILIATDGNNEVLTSANTDPINFGLMTTKSVIEYGELMSKIDKEKASAVILGIIESVAEIGLSKILPENSPIRDMLIYKVLLKVSEEVRHETRHIVVTENGYSISNLDVTKVMSMFFTTIKTIAEKHDYDKEQLAQIMHITIDKLFLGR